MPGSTTLSPFLAESGIALISLKFRSAAKSRKPATMPSKVPCAQPTRSILFTASTTRRIPRFETSSAWRRVCRVRPCRASTRITATSAVEAPVAMLRVYCSWPGVSATMNERLSVEKNR